MGGLWKWWTGPPVDVTITCKDGTCGDAGNFVGVVRPDRVAGVSPYVGRNNLTWLNPAAFLAPTNGSVGDIRRNDFRGPGINNWDMSPFKNIHFTESVYLQLRLESYNTLNHPQPNNAGVGFTSNTAGSPATSLMQVRDSLMVSAIPGSYS